MGSVEQRLRQAAGGVEVPTSPGLVPGVYARARTLRRRRAATAVLAGLVVVGALAGVAVGAATTDHRVTLVPAGPPGRSAAMPPNDPKLAPTAARDLVRRCTGWTGDPQPAMRAATVPVVSPDRQVAVLMTPGAEMVCWLRPDGAVDTTLHAVPWSSDPQWLAHPVVVDGDLGAVADRLTAKSGGATVWRRTAYGRAVAGVARVVVTWGGSPSVSAPVVNGTWLVTTDVPRAEQHGISVVGYDSAGDVVGRVPAQSGDGRCIAAPDGTILDPADRVTPCRPALRWR